MLQSAATQIIGFMGTSTVAARGGGPIILPMLRILILALLVASPLLAQDPGVAREGPPASDFELTVKGGINDVVMAPWGRLVVQVRKTSAAPFVGRVTVVGSEYAGRGRRRGPMEGMTTVTLHADVNLEEGPASRTVEFDLPALSGSLNAEVTLERQITGNYYEAVANESWSAPTLNAGTQQVAFISKSRLAMAQEFFFFRALELPYQEVPTSWKPLAGFAAIVLNDDRLSREQFSALIDYLTGGGTVILSPTAASSFNPETLAGRLLKVPTSTTPNQKMLSDYPFLMAALVPSGQGGMRHESTMPPGSEGEMLPETEPMPAAGGFQPHLPASGATIAVWPDGGRARPIPGFEGLASIARVGAGNLVLLHVDISREPWALDNTPTHPTVNLLAGVFTVTAKRASQAPSALLMDTELRDAIDIAGRRVPGRALIVLLLMGYIAVAGIGMFLIARKLKRPELYPAALLVAAALSVGLVFSIGAVYKRTGDRVRAVRVVVSDETTERNAVFTLGCSYVVDDTSFRFTTPSQTGHLPLAADSGNFGQGFNAMSYVGTLQGGDLKYELSELDRWQNVFFIQRSPGAVQGLRVKARSFEGGVEVQNLSPHKLGACVMVVGASGTSEPQWHYVSGIGATGSADEKITFSQSTTLPPQVSALTDKLRDDVGNDLAHNVMLQLYNLDPTNPYLVAQSWPEVSAMFSAMGVMPGEGEFLLICLLPPDALDKASLGTREVDDDDIAQVNLWMIRGGVENR